MNYTDLLTELNKASTFDLFRLYAAIEKELDSPIRLRRIKENLNIGMNVSYFNPVKNKLIAAKLVSCRLKTAVVFDYEQQIKIIVPYYILNLDNVETNIYQDTSGLTANNLQVGEHVGFKKDGESFAGVITRLNQKTVSLNVIGSGKWRVSYTCLHRIYDAEANPETEIPTPRLNTETNYHLNTPKGIQNNKVNRNKKRKKNKNKHKRKK